jgi:hypothetical protein
MVLRIPAGTSGFFFLRDSAILNSLVSQVQAVSFYLVRCVGVLSVIGQNKLSCDWSE